jgi:ABC-type multidrug transport system ATPase subunit
LAKRFGGLNALSGVDFHIDEGEIVSMIGPNGAGKTTFFNAISGMYPPMTGEALFKGQNIAGLSSDQITKIGIARTFQNVRLFPNMTVLENVMVAQHCRTKQERPAASLPHPGFLREEAEIEERAKEILSFFGTVSTDTGGNSRRSCSPTPTGAVSRSPGRWRPSPPPPARRAHGGHEPAGDDRTHRADRASSATRGASPSW